MSGQHNRVELLGTYGGDETHAMSAWTSTARELTDDKRERMGKLLKMLAEKGHHTPFEKSTQHFLVTTDIATHIHLIKHRIGVSVNAESARYRELIEDKHLLPSDWDASELVLLMDHCKESFERYHATMERLEAKYGRKRAKESARFYLPYATQITADVSFNFRSFMHFQGLRNKPDAQLEVREVAAEMLRLVKDTGDFDLSLEAFGYTFPENGTIK